MFRPFIKCIAASTLSAWLLTGCSSTELIGEPELNFPAAFSVSGSGAPSSTWWKELKRREIDALIEQGFTNNPSLSVTQARLRQADAVVRRASASLFPSVSGDSSLAASSTRRDGRTTSDSTTGVGLSARYEVDLWGRVRAGRDAAINSRDAVAMEVEASKLSLAGAVATTWLQIAEQSERLDLLRKQLNTSIKALDILQLRARRGQSTSLDIAQQEQQVESLRGNIIVAESALLDTQNALAILVGSPPGRVRSAATGGLPSIDPFPRTGVPAKRLNARPDVHAAWLRVAAADRDVAAAIADRYPALSISARGESTAESAADLFDNWFANLAGNLVAPLIDGGARRAEVERSRGVLDEALARYREVTLDAYGEVESAIVRERAQRAFLASVRKQLEQARLAEERASRNYLRGQESYLRVLDAFTSRQILERTELATRREIAIERVNLYRALAGPIR